MVEEFGRLAARYKQEMTFPTALSEIGIAGDIASPCNIAQVDIHNAKTVSVVVARTLAKHRPAYCFKNPEPIKTTSGTC